ncbi:MAG TPA: bifunctional diaminohydroxyphosphoribosylaminopyrimidine deaminase/5-amino-6-(5-phosphoribosylamino)uracil reductase RibD [Candidatus Acidoferrum sp.]|nr:bifunctional diaminohydroxyphosphoribosylaminopyrimidine deaminase/5-amino-6-(5-phosphoribosylamino)uracil reductase RibD [Candidatus Acidoferrum sp.]
MTQDELYMQRAFALARQALSHARPNPAVGCVLVQGGNVVGEGFTQPPGHAHAEIEALQAAGSAANGATAYVSLEPCAHHGRTGPCAEALVKAGVARVVYALADPNPLVNGKGLALLRAGGVAVEGPLLPDQAAAINAGFIKRMTRGLPYVRCKVGMSLDARTAMASGESQWITGPAARADVQQWRAQSCAVLTGIGTVLLDDPALTVRIDDYRGLQPLRVVVDTDGRIPHAAKLLQLPGHVVLATSEEAAERLSREETCNSGLQAQCTLLPLSRVNGKLNLRLLLERLATDFHCNDVLVEAGATLTGALLQAGVVDELITYIAPALLGDLARPLAILPGLHTLGDKVSLRFLDVAMLGEDCRIRSLVL